MGYNIFFEKEPLLDKHIRELKYQQSQKHEDNNSLMLKKLDEDYGLDNTASLEEIHSRCITEERNEKNLKP